MTTSSTSSVVSVAGSSSAAAAGGSVINVTTLVSELVAATRAPQDAQIAKQTQTVTTQISAVGTLKSSLAAFQSALSSLSTASAFAAQSATSSDPTVFTASAGSSAAGGTYSVAISRLAQAQQLVSTAFTGGSSAILGTGTLTLSLGTQSVNISIDSSNDTLVGIAAAINSASGNPGIDASVVTGTDGAHLVLASSLPGAANTIQISQTGALTALTYSAGAPGHYAQQSQAKDAAFSIAGVPYTSSSNTVSDAISGVTLNLLGTTAVDTPATLTLANDTSTVQDNIKAFVAAYNTLQGSLGTLGSFDSTTGTAGPLLGDALLGGVQNQVRQILYSQVGSGTYNTLASIGITSNSDGTLSINNSTLATALNSNFSAVSQLFTSKNGVAAQLNTQLGADLASGGSVDSRSKTLIKQDNALSTQTNTLNSRMTALTASLTQQYSSLNALLSSLQTTSAYLTQAFNNLPTVQGKANA